MMSINGKVLGVLLLTAIFAVTGFAQADKLTDLVDTKAAGGETELETRGYEHHHTSKDENGSWSYWWNSSKKKCVMVLTTDGKYSKIDDAEKEDCGKKSGLSTTSKVAIAIAAAAAIGGTAAIVHKAHDHDDDRHWEDGNRESEYERGHRDGLYNTSYHNWNNSRDYSSGYASGVRERNNNTSYHSGWGGYRPHVNVKDLQGDRASGAENAMNSRGFQNRNTYKVGDASYQIWFNGNSRQCVQVIVSDGRYENVRDIGSSPYCR
ncbi:MAG: hypothetical protein KA956_01870 [Pyrinomonadaceae bacterium]|nr:hypothetical protein [Acidobacteriota bacterium]MBK7934829.1 hypothetical protein [Acidobacteriota bacterium]MBP7375203.1 hypothetical protein [Pyrinomonadaceae bacterium]